MNSTLTMNNQTGWKQGCKFTVAESPEAFKMLSGGLYSDPIKAIVRELFTNAVDSHIEAENPNPIQIHLPTETDPTYTIRDFGIGMTNEFIRENWSSYFSSTKRQDTSTTGKFGLGSKSPLSYVKSFHIISYYHGQKTRWIVQEDKEGYPEIIEEESSYATDEPTGIKIVITIPPRDHTKFYKAAEEVFQFSSHPIEFIDCVFRNKKPDYKLFHKGQLCDWGIHNGRVSRVIMGNVAYDLSNEFNDYSIDLYVDVDTFEVVPNREAIRYLDNTKKHLIGLIEAASIEANQLLDEKYQDHWSSLYEKHKWLQSFSNTSGGTSSYFASSIIKKWIDRTVDILDDEIAKWVEGRAVKIERNWGNLTISQNFTTIFERKEQNLLAKIDSGELPSDLRDRPQDYQIALRAEEFNFARIRHLYKSRRAKHHTLVDTDYIKVSCIESNSNNDEKTTLLIQDRVSKINLISEYYRVLSGQVVYLITLSESQFIDDITEFGIPVEIKLLSECPEPPKGESVKRTKNPNHVPIPRSVGCFYYESSEQLYRSRSDIREGKYYVPLCDVQIYGGLNYQQRKHVDLFCKKTGIDEKSIIYIKKQYLNQYTHLENLFDYAYKWVETLVTENKELCTAIWIAHISSTWETAKGQTVTLRKPIQELVEMIGQLQINPKLDEKVLSHTLFESWVKQGYTSFVKARNELWSLADMIEGYIGRDRMHILFRPIIDEVEEILVKFRDQNPWIFYTYKQSIQNVFGVTIDDWSKHNN